jgi:hypothetical protein
MFSRNVLAAALAVVVLHHGHLPRAVGDDKKAEAPAGTWVKSGAELKIEFQDKGVLRIAPHGNKEAVIVCSYTAGKAGAVAVKVTDHEGSDDFKAKIKDHAPVGLEFEFTWTVKDGKATLSEVKGKSKDVLSSHLEGEYEKK